MVKFWEAPSPPYGEEAFQRFAEKGPCPQCGATGDINKDGFIGSNPNRPCGGLHRCYACGFLWGTDGTVIDDTPLPPEALKPPRGR